MTFARFAFPIKLSAFNRPQVDALRPLTDARCFK